MTPFAYTGFGTHAPYFFAVERPLAEAVMENAAARKATTISRSATRDRAGARVMMRGRVLVRCSGDRI